MRQRQRWAEGIPPLVSIVGFVVAMTCLSLAAGCGVRVRNPVFTGDVGVMELQRASTGRELASVEVHGGEWLGWLVEQLQGTGLGAWLGLPGGTVSAAGLGAGQGQ